jgi:hypothetical protein
MSTTPDADFIDNKAAPAISTPLLLFVPEATFMLPPAVPSPPWIDTDPALPAAL